MKTRAGEAHSPVRRILLHQAALVLPVALLASAVICDLLFALSGARLLSEAASWLIGLGLAAALLSAPFGVADWLQLRRDNDALVLGSVHGLVNLLALLLFAVSLWLRLPDPEPLLYVAYLFSLAGLGLVGLSGWLWPGSSGLRGARSSSRGVLRPEFS